LEFDPKWNKTRDAHGGEPMRKIFLCFVLIFVGISVDAQPSPAGLTDQKAIESAIAAQADA